MKSNLLIIAVALVLISSFAMSACKEKEHNHGPEITISSPTEGQVVMAGDTLNILGLLTDDHSLHEAFVYVESHDGDTVFQAEPYVHDLTTYSMSYKFATTDTGHYHLHVKVEDHDDAVVEKEVMFNVHP